MCIPVHSPWLPGCIDVAQTVLLILTMAGVFPDLLCMSGSFLSGTPHIKYPMLTGHCCGSPGRPTSKVPSIHSLFNQYLLSMYYVPALCWGESQTSSIRETFPRILSHSLQIFLHPSIDDESWGCCHFLAIVRIMLLWTPCANISLRLCFQLFGIYTQKQNFWIKC